MVEEIRTWISHEVAHNLQVKDQRNTLQVPFASTPSLSAAQPGTGGNAVTFEPGARTAWHTHPLGQTLIVTEGYGRAQRWGGPIEEIRPGDVIWFPPGEKHWHGASPITAMTHIAIQEALDGKAVDWMETRQRRAVRQVYIGHLVDTNGCGSNLWMSTMGTGLVHEHV